MNENENLELNNSENVETVTTEESTGVQEQPTEQPVEKTYTQAEVDEIVGKRLARNTAKIHKEYDKKYGQLENVLRAGTGKTNVEEMTDTFREFYENKGIQIPTEPTYTARDTEILAKAEAEDIIKAGYEEVVEEVDRLAEIGTSNMTAREKAVFTKLADYRKTAERSNELLAIGVKEEVYNSKEFNEFASKFSSDTSVTEIYEIYNKMQPKKEIRTMGSLKSTPQTDTGVKEFYSKDEALKFTKKDFDNNPELYNAVSKSMLKWK